MPRGRPKKNKEEGQEEIEDEAEESCEEECCEEECCEEECCEELTEKERLLALRKQLTDLRVNSVSDLDGLISRAE